MNQLSDVAYWAEAWKNDPHSPIKKNEESGTRFASFSRIYQVGRSI